MNLKLLCKYRSHRLEFPILGMGTTPTMSSRSKDAAGFLTLPRKLRFRVYKFLNEGNELRIHLRFDADAEKRALAPALNRDRSESHPAGASVRHGAHNPSLYRVVATNLNFSIGRVCKGLSQEAISSVYRYTTVELCHDNPSLVSMIRQLSCTALGGMIQARAREAAWADETDPTLWDTFHKLAWSPNAFRTPDGGPIPLELINLSCLPKGLRTNLRSLVVSCHHLKKTGPGLKAAFPALRFVTTEWPVYVSRPKKATSKQVANALKAQLETAKTESVHGNMMGGRNINSLVSTKGRQFQLYIQAPCFSKDRGWQPLTMAELGKRETEDKDNSTPQGTPEKTDPDGNDVPDNDKVAGSQDVMQKPLEKKQDVAEVDNPAPRVSVSSSFPSIH